MSSWEILRSISAGSVAGGLELMRR